MIEQSKIVTVVSLAAANSSHSRRPSIVARNAVRGVATIGVVLMAGIGPDHSQSAKRRKAPEAVSRFNDINAFGDDVRRRAQGDDEDDENG